MELKLFRIVDVCLSDYSLNYTDTRVGRDLDNTRGKLHESNVHLSDILRGQIDKIVLHETSGWLPSFNYGTDDRTILVVSESVPFSR